MSQFVEWRCRMACSINFKSMKVTFVFLHRSTINPYKNVCKQQRTYRRFRQFSISIYNLILICLVRLTGDEWLSVCLSAGETGFNLECVWILIVSNRFLVIRHQSEFNRFLLHPNRRHHETENRPKSAVVMRISRPSTQLISPVWWRRRRNIFITIIILNQSEAVAQSFRDWNSVRSAVCPVFAVNIVFVLWLHKL